MSYNELKKNVMDRANQLCEYCKSPANFSPDPFCIEHIIPQSKGGETLPENLALSCYGCNNHKYNKIYAVDITTGNTVLLFNPRKNAWNEHFRWNENATKIIGLTSHGRATVDELKLNREQLQNLRKLLFEAGEHPPNE
jgi:hypothetical protein